MPTTTKMGIVYPSSTDLVKDGATAMGTISTTVDSKTGLVLLNTTTFTTQSSVSIASVFNANFTNYRIHIEQSGTAGVSLFFRLRSGSTDNTSANYNGSGFYQTAAAGTPTGQTYQSQTYWWIGECGNGTQGYSVIDLMRPFETATTGYFGNAIYNASSTSAGHERMGGGITVTTSYDGFTFLPSSGTITGTVRVYGYN